MQVVWLEPLPVKTEAKMFVEYLNLLHILGNQLPHSLLERTHIFPSLPFTTYVPIETFTVVLEILGQV